MVVYKERHVTELVKFIQVRYTINSDGLLLSRENYVLWMVRNFLLIIRREDLLSIEDLCSTVESPSLVLVINDTKLLMPHV